MWSIWLMNKSVLISSVDKYIKKNYKNGKKAYERKFCGILIRGWNAMYDNLRGWGV